MAKQEEVKATEPTLAEVMATMAAILKEQQAARSQQDARIEVENLNTEEARRAGRRLGPAGAYENAFPPDISAYNPLGERDHARPELKCMMIWVGYKLTKEALTRQEIELLNKMVPGEYRVHKSNGQSIPFYIEGKNDLAGKLERLTFHFACKNKEDRMDHRSMVAYLKEVLDPSSYTEG